MTEVHEWLWIVFLGIAAIVIVLASGSSELG